MQANRLGMARSWLLFALTAVVLSGCARFEARDRLEHVARDWCDTLRASQVICVYPPTRDLRPGDVFLVQSAAAEQFRNYRDEGFLPLDDHRTRLHGLNYLGLYPELGFADSCETIAPHQPVAFPSYSFNASSAAGLNTALPLQGLAIGLDYLQAQAFVGDVIIRDATTCGVDASALYRALESWARDSQVSAELNMLIRQSGREHLILRVVSRVYYAAGLEVRVSAAEQRGLGINDAASLPPVQTEAVDASSDATLPSASAAETPTPDTALGRLNEQVSILTGGTLSANGAKTAAVLTSPRVKFTSASNSGFSLVNNFSQPLVIGYLGIDVPVFEGGVLGAHIPTFEVLAERSPLPLQRPGELSYADTRFQLERNALTWIAEANPEAALAIMRDVIASIGQPYFRASLEVINASDATGKVPVDAVTAVQRFNDDAMTYVQQDAQARVRHQRFSDAFLAAYGKHLR